MRNFVFFCSDRGNCYFYGYNATRTSMWQITNITDPIDIQAIDNQSVGFNLSAWLGGFLNQNDHVVVSVTFFNQALDQINNQTNLPVVRSSNRQSTTKLVFRNVTDRVPASTRFLKVTVEIIWDAGDWNNGYVDNIALVLFK